MGQLGLVRSWEIRQRIRWKRDRFADIKAINVLAEVPVLAGDFRNQRSKGLGVVASVRAIIRQLIQVRVLETKILPVLAAWVGRAFELQGIVIAGGRRRITAPWGMRLKC
jgi:hypothetical protein